ncbi:CDGSH iron-sulfur domain-containing protein [Pimephales promelas]|nr:CDGSH iron-sulfur domain-containing protein [Pimephales promelas]
MASQVPGLSALIKPGLIPGFKVSKDQLTTIVPIAVAAALSTYLLTRYFSSQSSPASRVNLTVKKDSPKVVHSFDMEDIGNKAVYCRCWRSKKVSETMLIGCKCLLNEPAGLFGDYLFELFLTI